MMQKRALGVVVLGLSLLTACGDELPPAATDGLAGSLAPVRVAADGDANGPCEPEVARECHLVSVDEYGVTHCPKTWQFCNAEGTGFHECGDFDTAEDGTPLPPAHPRKPAPSGKAGNGAH